MSDSLFAANYELKHIADQDAMFHNPVFTSEESLLHNGIGHVDAAYGGADATAHLRHSPQPVSRGVAERYVPGMGWRAARVRSELRVQYSRKSRAKDFR